MNQEHRKSAGELEPPGRTGYGARASSWVPPAPAKAWAPQTHSNNLDDDWADSYPWDRRGKAPVDLDLDLDLDDDLALEKEYSPTMLGEPPTSQVVRSYFSMGGSPSGAEPQQRKPHGDPVGARLRGQLGGAPGIRHSHWEGTDAYATLYGGAPHSKTSAPSADSGRGQAPSQPECREPDEQSLELERCRLALEQQIKQYGQDQETLKKLQARAEQAERDLVRDREKLWREVEAEKSALHAEFDVERAALKRERRRLSQTAERHRQQQSEERELVEENRKLRERVDHLEEEVKDKDKRWQRTVDRLQRQNSDLTRKNQELQEDVRRATSQIQQAQPSHSRDARRSTSATSARSRRSGDCPKPKLHGQAYHADPPFRTDSVGQSSGSPPTSGSCDFNMPASSSLPLEKVAATGSAGAGLLYPGGAEETKSSGGMSAGQPSCPDVKEVRTVNGRTEKVFADGRKEIDFANGLRKILWADGRTTVLFQNGDRKEISVDGVVVYHYAGTGATQTTLPCGDEVYEFADGQHERHRPDGTKEIRFPNGTTKSIFADGSEEVCFADGTVRRTVSAA